MIDDFKDEPTVIGEIEVPIEEIPEATLEAATEATPEQAAPAEETVSKEVAAEPAAHKHELPRGLDLFSWETWGFALLVLFLVILIFWGIWPLLLLLLFWLAV